VNTPFDGALSLPDYYHYIPRVGGQTTQFIIDQILRFSFKGVHMDLSGLYAMRQRIVQVDKRFGRRAADMRITDTVCDDVPAQWLEVPQSRHDRVFLYLNGGAFCMRIPRMQSAMVARWCRKLGARALMPHYRLAPEHPYPAAPDDCLAAYRWLLAHGVPANNIVICGDSAGGNLTLVTLMRARDAGLPLPAAAVLLSPATDFSASGRSAVVNESIDPMFSLPLLRWFGELYLTEMELYLHPTLSPLTGEFHDLPPMLYQAGSNEMLLDDSTRAAAKAHAAGVTVKLEVYEGMPHVFQTLPGIAETRHADRSIVEFISANTHWKPVARNKGTSGR
jgi:epsilon-lactone hydrolase